jgi:parallel beta-helix repeat protein
MRTTLPPLLILLLMLTAGHPARAATRHIDQEGAVISGQTFNGVGLLITARRVRIEGNTFENACPSGERHCRAIWVRGTQDVILRGNRVRGTRGTAIRIDRSRQVTVEGNDISGNTCVDSGEGRMKAEGIKIAQDSSGIRVVGNHIHDFVSCPASGGLRRQMTAIYCDTGPSDSVALGNRIHHIGVSLRGQAGNAQGIYIEARCNRWRVAGNVIEHIGSHGIRNASPSNTNDGNVYQDNVISNIAEDGILLTGGTGIRLEGNVIGCYQGAAIRMDRLGGHHVGGDRNHYTQGERVARRGGQMLPLQGWRGLCGGCDPHATTGAHPAISASCEITRGPVVDDESGVGFPPPIHLRGAITGR